jgi:hypothetical protein
VQQARHALALRIDHSKSVFRSMPECERQPTYAVG